MKQGQRAEVNTFVQGLITEASPLNFPPNASKEEENFELYRDGTRKRRKGIDLEAGAFKRQCPSFSEYPPPVPVFNAFVWENAAGIVGRDFLVVQNGNSVDLYDPEVVPLSPAQTDGGGFLTNLDLIGGNTNYSFASIDGILMVATDLFIYKVIFNGFDAAFPVQIFEKSVVTLKVRDFWGVETGDTQLESDIYYRPASLSPLHNYNLYNQSWGVARKHQSGVMVDPVAQYFGQYSKYPSNSEVVWTGLQFQPVATGQDPFERLYMNLYDEVFGLAPLAAKGYFIIDALKRGPSRKAQYQTNYDRSSGVLASPSFFDPPEDTTEGGPTLITAYAGRVWYGGFQGEVTGRDSRSPNLSNYVLFSQLVRNADDIPKCYQEGDPTSREGSDIVDTDGGFIKITGMNKMIGMEVLGSSLIVFGDNGVWQISGGSDYGFTASNYKVTEISNYGCISRNTTLVQGNTAMYWGDNGIYTISPNNLGTLVCQSVSKTTIQSLYNSIPKDSKAKAWGVYDDVQKKARWLYKTGAVFGVDSKTYELLFDFDIGCFSLNTIKNLPSKDIEAMCPFIINDEVKYVAYVKTGTTFNKYSFCQMSDSEFIDWKSQDGVGVDAKAFVLTGAQIAGDSAVFKQAPYIVIHMERTETGTDATATPLNQSSCLFRTVWDFSRNDDVSNKVGQMQQAYRYRRVVLATPNSTYDNGLEVITTKNKIRGRGRSIALYMETEPKKHCHILGWNITLNGNPIA